MYKMIESDSQSVTFELYYFKKGFFKFFKTTPKSYSKLPQLWDKNLVWPSYSVYALVSPNLRKIQRGRQFFVLI